MCLAGSGDTLHLWKRRLQPPVEGQVLTLWQNAKLRVQTGPIADLIASKLIRYDEIDQSDIRYLLSQGVVAFVEITALLLHQALPSEGYASQRALNRLALYQAKSRAFGTVRFLKNIRRLMGRKPLSLTEVPGHLVRDVGLPGLSRAGMKAS